MQLECPETGFLFVLLDCSGGFALKWSNIHSLQAQRKASRTKFIIDEHFVSLTYRLGALFVAGEHCDHETMNWIQDLIQKPVLDHWWQTGRSQRTSQV